MSNKRVARITKDIAEVNSSPELRTSGIKIGTTDKLDVLTDYIRGPPNTPYECGEFLVELSIPECFPFAPPKVKFLTKIWHPNVSSQTGAICLNVLNSEEWSPMMTIRTTLMCVHQLLTTDVMNPQDPQDHVVAQQLISNGSLFMETAKLWAQVFANAPGEKNLELWNKCITLVELGMSQKKALMLLSDANWSLHRAIDEYLYEDF